MILIAIIAVELGYYRMAIKPMSQATAILNFANPTAQSEAMGDVSSKPVMALAAKDPIFRGRGLPISEAEVLRGLRWTSPPQTTILSIEMSSGNPAVDTEIVGAVGRAFAAYETPNCTMVATFAAKPVPLNLKIWVLVRPTGVLLAFLAPYIGYRIGRARRARLALGDPVMVTS